MRILPKQRRSRGLAGIDLNNNLVQGQTYTFHFRYTGLGIRIDPVAAAGVVAKDSNFKTPVGGSDDGGIAITFIYNGRSSLVGNAGKEMESVLNNSWNLRGFFNGLTFDSADGGSVASFNFTDPSPNTPGGNGGKPPSVSPIAIALGIGVVTIAGVLLLK